MSSQLKVTVLIEQDGVAVRRFVRRIGVAELQQFDYINTQSGYSSIPASELDEIQMLVIEPVDKALNIRLNTQPEGSVDLNAGGLLLLVDCTLNLSPAFQLLASVQNASGDPTQIRGLAGGI